MTEEVILVEAAKKGDKNAFTQLYGRVYKDLYRFAYYTLNNSHEAEDAVSEAVLAAYEGIGRLKDADAFHRWIFKILVNKCRQRFRSRRKDMLPLNEEIPDTEIDYAQNEDVKAAFFTLSDQERLIVSMFLFGGYKGEEIGHILHINHSTVRSKYRRSLKKLEQLLSRE